MKRKERHVVYNQGKEKWESKKNNAQRSSKDFETKQEAMDWSKEKAKKEKEELIPHKKDGEIQNPNSYGNDPNPPKDKKI